MSEEKQPSGSENENGEAAGTVTQKTANAPVSEDNNAGTDAAAQSPNAGSGELQTTETAYTEQTEQTPQTAQTAQIEQTSHTVPTSQTVQPGQASQIPQTLQVPQAVQTEQVPQTAQTLQAEQTPQNLQTSLTLQPGQIPQIPQIPQTPQPSQSPQTPEYGALKEPEYGALASQFPPDYDPYLYGRPDPPSAPENPDGSGVQGAVHGLHAPGFLHPGGAQSSGGAPHSGSNPPTGHPVPTGQPVQAGQNAPGYQPRIVHGIDVNDPNQNPLYGRWDMYAIMSLAFAILMVPVLPTIMGAMAMWRTKTFHMRGFWLGLAAVIINIAASLFSMWLMSRGIAVDEVYDWMVTHIQGNSNQDGIFSV